MQTKILSILLHLTIKDWLILVTLSILFICLLEIRKLKKLIILETQRQLVPQLTLELVLNKDLVEAGFFIKNDSFFLARNIKVEDVGLTLDDYGFKVYHILKFDGPEVLKPQESARLPLKVYNKNNEFVALVTESIIPHLISPAFKVKVNYTNIENRQFCITFNKKREKFYVESVESSNKPII
jgi:hypothetical protein